MGNMTDTYFLKIKVLRCVCVLFYTSQLYIKNKVIFANLLLYILFRINIKHSTLNDFYLIKKMQFIPCIFGTKSCYTYLPPFISLSLKWIYCQFQLIFLKHFGDIDEIYRHVREHFLNWDEISCLWQIYDKGKQTT